ncbi:GNAT family N-acetyltransferase [Amycolatopsis sp. NPDC054798]
MVDGIVVRRFYPEAEDDAGFARYHNVVMASQIVDRPSDPCIPLEETIGQLKNPLPGRGESAFWVGSKGDNIVSVAQVQFLSEEQNGAAAITDIVVHPNCRRTGIGTAMLEAVLPELKVRGRDVIEGWRAVPGTAGQWWAESLGFSVVRTVVKQLLAVTEVDRSLWDVKLPEGYRLERWIGAAPESAIESYSVARDAIHDAPLNGSAYRWQEWTVQRVREAEAEWRRQGFEQRVVIAVHEQTSAVAGFTEVVVHPRRPDWGNQRETAVLSEHRGRALGRCLKAHMSEWLTADHPKLERIATATGADNINMIRVNSEIGYKTVGTVIAVQQELVQLEDYLAGYRDRRRAD